MGKSRLSSKRRSVFQTGVMIYLNIILGLGALQTKSHKISETTAEDFPVTWGPMSKSFLTYSQ